MAKLGLLKIGATYIQGPAGRGVQGRGDWWGRGEDQEEVRRVARRLAPTQTAWLSALLPSSGALTLISKVTDHANDSMEQGVSSGPGLLLWGADPGPPSPCPGLTCDALLLG